MQYDLGNFLPVCVLGFGVEQAKVSNVVLFVISGNVGADWSLIFDIWIKWVPLIHETCPLLRGRGHDEAGPDN